MVLLAFLVDTSASMNQRTCLGTSYLDLAKGAVESFLKIRARDTNNSRGDRYMLVTYDEPTESIKAGWRENLQIFLGELKNLNGHGLSNVGRALKETFDLLNMHRLQSGIDNYGHGRNPYYLEPALVLLLTDGCSALDINGIIKEIKLPTHDLLPGAELTKELYRWDQRLFTLQLKIPGFSYSMNEKLASLQQEDMPLSNLCDQTGGKLYSIGSHKNLMQSLESVAQKIMVPGVTINFDKYGPDPQEIIHEVAPDHLKVEDDNYITNDLDGKDKINHCNGEIPLHNGVLENNNRNIGFNNIDAMQSIGMNGFVNGQGILPSPYSNNSRGFVPNSNDSGNKQQNRLLPNGLVDVNDKLQVKTEGLSSSSSGIPEIPIRGNDEPLLDGNVMSPCATNPNKSTVWHSQRRMIYVRNNIKGSVGHWPIPESFWPESASSRLPPRDCQPIVKFTCKQVDAMVIDNMPFDKYELEPSPLTQYILERRQPNVAWQTFVSGSSPDSEIGYPFGYLKAATNLQCVNFFVMPYNYPVIMPLLDELFKIHKCKPTQLWKQNFQEYLQTVPAYYYAPLRNALRRMGAPNNLLPDHLDGALSYSVVAYLKKMKNQGDRHGINSQKNENVSFTPHSIHSRIPQLVDGKLRDFKDLLIQKITSNSKKSTASNVDATDVFERRPIPNNPKKYSAQTFRNPFDIRHSEVIEHVSRMRLNFFHISSMATNERVGVDDDVRHGVSIAQMGNYQDHVNQFKPLREVDPSQVRVHTFGNPFKLKQDQIIAVDEADVTENMQNARKRGNEMAPSLQKGKRKRSDTPPPSRRPVGATPNTPPPKHNKPNDENEKRNDGVRSMPDQKGVLKDLAVSLENSIKINNTTHNIYLDNDTKEPDKKPSSSVNRQLRKLQQMHRIKKDNTELYSDNDELSDCLESSSPILSILRTSLEEPEDKDNDELRIINEGTNLNNGTNKKFTYNDNRSSSASNSSSSTTPIKTPVSAIFTPLLMEDMFTDLPPETLRKIYMQLHTREVVKNRLAIWQAIRERSDFSIIANLIKDLNIDVEAKYMFTMNLMKEADKFQLVNLESKLKKVLGEIQRMINS